jgi:hypothetical protein
MSFLTNAAQKTNRNRSIRNLCGMLLIGAISVSAAAPIRVGIFKGVGAGAGTRWHESTHAGSAAIAAMLANPAQAGLQDPPIPSRGFSIAMFGVDTSCNNNGCAPSAEQLAAFIAALDTLDVVIFPNNTSIGNAIVDSNQRQRLNAFWLTRGVIALYASVDTRGTWALWDSIHGARFSNWLAAQNGTVHLDTAEPSSQFPSRKYLNRGLPDTARLIEEWIVFADSGARIRSRAGLVPTVNLDEKSLTSTSGPRMGDHPASWYRELPQGGRFFYTSLGRRIQLYDSAFFRRQVYNAVLWASKDTTGWGVYGGVGVRDARASAASPLKAWVSGSRIHVRVAEGATVELFSLDGTLRARKHSQTATTFEIQNPSLSETFIVRARGPGGTQSALVGP